MNINDLIKAPLRAALKFPKIRKAIGFELRHSYYKDLGFEIPLKEKLWWPVTTHQHLYSFHEIFLANEYACLGREVPVPSKWLDLGCHAGLFSMYCIWLRRGMNLPEAEGALLVDADERSREAVDAIRKRNKLEKVLNFAHGAIHKTPGELVFNVRECMTSSVFENAETPGREVRVPVLTQEDILKLLPPPYDVVKIDVEGSEWDFLTSYPKILSQTRWILFEWHSWHGGGNGSAGLLEKARELGFERIAEVIPAHEVADPKGAECGVWLLKSKT